MNLEFLDDEIDSLHDTVESTVRNGVVSADTKLIAQTIRLVACQLIHVTKCIESISEQVQELTNTVSNNGTELHNIAIETNCIVDKIDSTNTMLDEVRTEINKIR